MAPPPGGILSLTSQSSHTLEARISPTAPTGPINAGRLRSMRLEIETPPLRHGDRVWWLDRFSMAISKGYNAQAPGGIVSKSGETPGWLRAKQGRRETR